MNAECPNCGGHNLKATIKQTYKNVLLADDGYLSCETGTLVEDEIVEITCADCEESIDINHYYDD